MVSICDYLKMLVYFQADICWTKVSAN